MKLHNFHSSSASLRVRIALHLKGLAYEYVPVRLAWRDGDQDRPGYRDFNPQANVPVLVDGDVRIQQSLAILEYLEETHPAPPLLPGDPAGRARVRSLALWIACEIQPLNNLRVERFLAQSLAQDDDGLKRWRRQWIDVGFDALERMLSSSPATGRFCHGDRPTMADCCLVPQVRNALRPTVGADLSRWPAIERIHAACLALPEVERALPQHQPDYVPATGH